MKRFFSTSFLLILIVSTLYWFAFKMPRPLGSHETVQAEAPVTYTPATASPIVLGDVPFLEQLNREYSRISSVVLPSVVNISTTKKVDRQQMMSPFDQMPFFRQNPQQQNPQGPQGPQGPSRRQEASSLGSGVIVSKEGHIITNAHVIKGADTIKVRLSDHREFTAKVVGADAMTDIAVLRIEADNLQALAWGDSDLLKVGEQVLAVGNPFGLAESVSAGIVSAKRRNNLGFSGPNLYEDFIQTDAAINPGNSGGALVNIRGELIGINAAILSAGGGFNGIGFAIPSSLARFALEGLVKSGKVVRGYLGVAIQSVTSEMAKFYDLPMDEGALVTEITPNSPAIKAELQRGDLIIEIDGIKVKDPSQLRLAVSRMAPGKEVKLVVMRRKSEKTLKLVIGEQPMNFGTAGQENEEPGEAPASDETRVNNVFKGVRVQNLDPNLRDRSGIAPDASGVIVVGVEEGSAAETSGLLPGMVIQEVQPKGESVPQEVRDVKGFLSMARKIKANEDVLLFVRRGKSSSFLLLKAQ